jgi:hypothetical protein
VLDQAVLDRATASRYAATGLANVAREYPNHPGHLLTGPDDLLPPSVLHPIFFGSYDWHSSVHQHWMLVRLLRRIPDLPEAAAIRRWFDERVTTEAAEVEAAYLTHPQRRSFERPYGWAWLVTLAAELHTWDDPAADRWAAALTPLTSTVRERTLNWLESTPYPQRSGTHANSAFACVLVGDAAAATGDGDLRDAVDRAATRWYGDDAGYPAWLEPSATDFLSQALVEADLLSRVLSREAFVAWFDRFLPDPAPLAVPAVVGDRSDPHTVHLDGLNLSRAWCWRRLATALPQGHALRPIAAAAADRHADAALPHVLSDEYVGEHWLPTFAVHLLTGGVA